MDDARQIDTPDLARGIAVDSVADAAVVLGHVGDDEVLVTRAGGEWFAVGAHCTHYHGPLAEGFLVGDTVRCPWHHACFSLETGEALRAPALDPIACWRVERRATGSSCGRRCKSRDDPRRGRVQAPSSIVILGGGAAGLAAADMLSRDAYDGPITMISADRGSPRRSSQLVERLPGR